MTLIFQKSKFFSSHEVSDSREKIFMILRINCSFLDIHFPTRHPLVRFMHKTYRNTDAVSDTSIWQDYQTIRTQTIEERNQRGIEHEDKD